jgi:hypothetical protein
VRIAQSAIPVSSSGAGLHSSFMAIEPLALFA